MKIALVTDDNVSFKIQPSDLPGTVILTIADTDDDFILTSIDEEFMRALVEYYGKVSGTNLTVNKPSMSFIRSPKGIGPAI
jgi:hypothetical protein